LLGVHYNLDLKFEEQEKLSINGITNDLRNIRTCSFTFKQKCNVINSMIIPKVSSRMNTIIYSNKTLEEMDKKIKEVVCDSLNIQKKCADFRIYRRFDDLGPNISSLRDEQLQAFVATAIHNGLNSQAVYPRTCLKQRYLDNNYDMTNLKPMRQKELQNSGFWENLTNSISVFKGSCKTIGLNIDFNNQNKVPVLELENNIFTHNNFDLMINNNQEEFVPVFTDGSLANVKGTVTAGSAAVWKTVEKNHWKDKTVGKQTSLNSELFAYEAALSIAPIDKNLIIFTDCLSGINSLNEKKYSQIRSGIKF